MWSRAIRLVIHGASQRLPARPGTVHTGSAPGRAAEQVHICQRNGGGIARVGGPALSPSCDRFVFDVTSETGQRTFEDFNVNRPDHGKGHVSHRDAPRGAAVQRSEMCVSVNNEVRSPSIQDHAQLTVPQHPVFRQRLATQRACGRCVMGCRNAHIRTEVEEGTLERRTFASSAKCEPLESSSVDRVWTFLWPKPTTAPGRAGNSNSSSVGQANDRSLAVQDLNATALKRSTERCPTQRSQVVISQDRDHGQSRGC